MDDVELADLVAVVIDHVADLVAVIDQHNVIRWANLRSEDVLGTSLDVWRGRSVIELIHPDDLPLGLELLVSAKASGRGIKEPVLFRLRGADDWVPLEVIASNVELPDGELVTVFSARPTAPRRDGAAIVSEAGERLSRMFEDAAIGMAQVGPRRTVAAGQRVVRRVTRLDQGASSSGRICRISSTRSITSGWSSCSPRSSPARRASVGCPPSSTVPTGRSCTPS